MKKYLLFLPVTIALAIFFYPTTSHSNATGSPGGKTGSPNDVGTCTGCHTNGVMTAVGYITHDIPVTGYEPGYIYNITVVVPGAGGTDPAGFEVTCEENTTNTKTGSFGIINPTSTQFTNNSSAVTHTTAGNSLDTWSFIWEAPIAGTGDITFYGAFIKAGYPIGNNQGDSFWMNSWSFSESTVNSTINLAEKSDFTFNSVNKTIESNTTISIYDNRGRIVLTTNGPSTNISHLNTGIYIVKSAIKSQKIILN